MPRIYLVIAALLGGLAVALGAFGAHGLQKITMDEKILKSFQTAVQYQMYHAIALLAVASLYYKFNSTLLKWAANCFILGIILFSGSLYLLTLLKIKGNDSFGFVGPITPIGGAFFIAGWVLLLFSFFRPKQDQ
jgi:uncharacterized membrane protein YgdD (TMEM256/DUF423 family)